MRLPQPQLDSLCYLFEAPLDVIHALAEACSPEEAAEIQRLFSLGLPPVTSVDALSVMFGYNPGFVWSFLNKTSRHYRTFPIPKGRGVRMITAPHVGLKAVQKWLSHHFQRSWYADGNVFGFVPGRSHVQAAAKHLGARWVYSIDIENFFPSVSMNKVEVAVRRLGYQTDQSIKLISRLACLGNGLAQGAPSSPPLSNIAMHDADLKLSNIATDYGITYTRYADDVVFSGKEDMPLQVPDLVKGVVTGEGWTLAAHKEELSALPARLKVHGLLVHGDVLRLTKGYRNRIRAYRHLLKAGKIAADDLRSVLGHIRYSEQIDQYWLDFLELEK